MDWPIHRSPTPWAMRPEPTRVLGTGTRSIDALLTLAQGQLLAWMGPPGTGSQTALAKLARECHTDLVVWACIGNLGLEMRAFLEQDLGYEGRQRSLL